MKQEQHPSKQTAEWERFLGDRLLRTLRMDPDKWAVADRRITLLGIVVGSAIVIIAICGYVFGWEWTGLAKRTFWDWLNLLIVPVVLALGGYLFTRSESRRAQDLAGQRAQDEALQAYVDQISRLLADKDRPLRGTQPGDEVRAVARALTLTVLRSLDGRRKGSIVQFLQESGLIRKDTLVFRLVRADLTDADLSNANLTEVDLTSANLEGADLSSADLMYADLSGANLRHADLRDTALHHAKLDTADLRQAKLNRAKLYTITLCDADLRKADLAESEGVPGEQLDQAQSLEDATMPDGQKYED